MKLGTVICDDQSWPQYSELSTQDFHIAAIAAAIFPPSPPPDFREKDSDSDYEVSFRENLQNIPNQGHA